MKKRLLSMLMLCCLALSLLPAAALAAPETEPVKAGPVQSSVSAAEPVTGSATADDNDDLFYQYMLQRAREEQGAVSLFSTGAEAAGSKYSDNPLLEKYYTILRNDIKAVAAGELESTSFSITPDQLEIRYGPWGEEDDLISKMLGPGMEVWEKRYDIVDALMADCPYELYWYDKTKGHGCYTSRTIYSGWLLNDANQYELWYSDGTNVPADHQIKDEHYGFYLCYDATEIPSLSYDEIYWDGTAKKYKYVSDGAVVNVQYLDSQNSDPFLCYYWDINERVFKTWAGVASDLKPIFYPATQVSFGFSVSREYGSGFTVTEGFNDAVSQAVTNARAVVDDPLLAGKSDYERLVAYKNWICEHVNYNHPAADPSYTGGYGNPWQLIWVFDNDTTNKVVCEGYSKAFQYLCDLSGFTGTQCYTVSGMVDFNDGRGPGGHMWNIVRMPDNRYYLVDVTNVDDEEGTAYLSPTKLFLHGITSQTGDICTINMPSGQKYIYEYNDYMSSLWGDWIKSLSTADYGECVITLAPGSGTVDPTSVTYYYNKAYTESDPFVLPIPVWGSNRFDGWWYMNASGAEVQVTADDIGGVLVADGKPATASLTAKWSCAVSYDGNDKIGKLIDAVIGEHDSYVPEGTSIVTLPTAQRKNPDFEYGFVGWFTSKDSSGKPVGNNDAEHKINDATTLYARWSFTPTMQMGDGALTTGPVTLIEGLNLLGQLPTAAALTPPEHYGFDHWSVDAVGGPAIADDAIASAAYHSTLYANWKLLGYRYTLTYQKNCEDEVVGIPTQVPYFSETEATHTFVLSGDKPTRSGYVFLGWGADPSATESIDSLPVTGIEGDTVAANVYAIWKELAGTKGLQVGETAWLAPAGGTWSSDNEAVAVVMDGIVIARGAGTAVVNDGTNYYAVNVSAPSTPLPTAATMTASLGETVITLECYCYVNGDDAKVIVLSNGALGTSSLVTACYDGNGKMLSPATFVALSDVTSTLKGGSAALAADTATAKLFWLNSSWAPLCANATLTLSTGA